ncbi:hypothetical protein M407DRAFT_11871 [Tulasnella calospora MUT 4182]|uniref:Uncharacterized protein n=1 Tax=Tulasnella calospora MUT 4182 TaxID=1051891 RepID=A0A0C3KAN6_9AGAM|nr:hypothetical protein M407DRAFT_11871 [Tulasnella calospora MUT 4182]
MEQEGDPSVYRLDAIPPKVKVLVFFVEGLALVAAEVDGTFRFGAGGDGLEVLGAMNLLFQSVKTLLCTKMIQLGVRGIRFGQKKRVEGQGNKSPTPHLGRLGIHIIICDWACCLTPGGDRVQRLLPDQNAHILGRKEYPRDIVPQDCSPRGGSRPAPLGSLPIRCSRGKKTLSVRLSNDKGYGGDEDCLIDEERDSHDRENSFPQNTPKQGSKQSPGGVAKAAHPRGPRVPNPK